MFRRIFTDKEASADEPWIDAVSTLLTAAQAKDNNVEETNNESEEQTQTKSQSSTSTLSSLSSTSTLSSTSLSSTSSSTSSAVSTSTVPASLPPSSFTALPFTATLCTATSWGEPTQEELDQVRARAAAGVAATVEQAAAGIKPAERERVRRKAYGWAWDRYYRRNSSNGFKQRKYLSFVFPELDALLGPSTCEAVPSPSPSPVIDQHMSLTVEQRSAIPLLTPQPAHRPPVHCEVGCGTGATLFPLAARFGNARFVGFDVSGEAVGLLRAADCYDETRMRVCVWDIANDDRPPVGTNSLPDEQPGVGWHSLADGSVDSASLIFVLSAIEVSKQRDVLRRVLRLLRPGGRLLIRDYAEYDLAQLRFHIAQRRRMEGNTYARHDGTLAHFFDLDQLTALAREAGFVVQHAAHDARRILNRKRKLVMHRMWCQVILDRPLEDEAQARADGTNSKEGEVEEGVDGGVAE